jgi:hypothetical protein
MNVVGHHAVRDNCKLPTLEKMRNLPCHPGRFWFTLKGFLPAACANRQEILISADIRKTAQTRWTIGHARGGFKPNAARRV